MLLHARNTGNGKGSWLYLRLPDQTAQDDYIQICNHLEELGTCKGRTEELHARRIP